MITTEIKERFIILRAENKSYSQIIKDLSISKSSCIKLNKELNKEISQAKTDNLLQLYNSFYMTKEAKIKNLGKTLKKIDKAIESIDFTALSPKDLLELKLKYFHALQEEYIPLETENNFNDNEIKIIIDSQENRIKEFNKLMGYVETVEEAY